MCLKFKKHWCRSLVTYWIKTRAICWKSVLQQATNVILRFSMLQPRFRTNIYYPNFHIAWSFTLFIKIGNKLLFFCYLLYIVVKIHKWPLIESVKPLRTTGQYFVHYCLCKEDLLFSRDYLYAWVYYLYICTLWCSIFIRWSLGGHLL